MLLESRGGGSSGNRSCGSTTRTPPASSARIRRPSVIRRVTAGTERLTAMPVDRAATKWYYTNMRLMAAPKTAPALSYGSTGGYVPPSFASVEEGLAVIDRGGPENLTSDTLREDLKWFTIQQRTLEAMSARWLGELDRREQQVPHDRLHPPPPSPKGALHLTPHP